MSPPTILSVRLVGGPVNSTGLRITFSEPMMPDSVDGRSHYRFGSSAYYYDKTYEDKDGDGHADDDEFIDEHDIYISQATYRDDDHSVLLRASRRFNPYKDLRKFKIYPGDLGLRDVAGNQLDGDKDGQAGGAAVLRFKTNYGKTISYFDHDGDKVTLKVGRTGNVAVLQEMVSTRQGKKGQAIQVWLYGNVRAWTVLTGKVKSTARGGDGHANIRELLGTEDATLKILDDPAFSFGTVGNALDP